MHQTKPGFNEPPVIKVLTSTATFKFIHSRREATAQLVTGRVLRNTGIGLGIFLMVIGFILMSILLIYPQPQPTFSLWILLCIFEVLSIIAGSILYGAGMIIRTLADGLRIMTEHDIINSTTLSDSEKEGLNTGIIP